MYSCSLALGINIGTDRCAGLVHCPRLPALPSWLLLHWGRRIHYRVEIAISVHGQNIVVREGFLTSVSSLAIRVGSCPVSSLISRISAHCSLTYARYSGPLYGTSDASGSTFLIGFRLPLSVVLDDRDLTLDLLPPIELASSTGG
jgi:hypothetical protein